MTCHFHKDYGAYGASEYCLRFVIKPMILFGKIVTLFYRFTEHTYFISTSVFTMELTVENHLLNSHVAYSPIYAIGTKKLLEQKPKCSLETFKIYCQHPK